MITEHSVEKVIHSIFLKLGLTWQPDINRRVKAVLVYLSEEGLHARPDRRSSSVDALNRSFGTKASAPGVGDGARARPPDR